MFGLALQNSTDNAVIDLTKLKGKITCFWNWAVEDTISFISDYKYDRWMCRRSID